MGLLATPAMMRYKYDKGLIAGAICAGGSLGTIIPPSVVVVIMGPVANVSVGDLLVGMVFPALILASSYLLYIVGRCTLDPAAGPRLPRSADEPPPSTRLRLTATALLPPLLLIFAVLGSIMLGLAARTEAAALGAAGAVALTAFYRAFSLAALQEALMRTLAITAMIMAIVLGGSLMSGAFVGAGGIAVTQDLVNTLGLGTAGLVAVVLAIAFVAGFFLDWISIVLILLPIFTPLLQGMGVDMVWFCILLLIVIQTSYLTPPMAPALFYFRAISPPEITTIDMYRGVIPFIILHFIPFAIVLAFPDTVLWLPRALFAVD